MNEITKAQAIANEFDLNLDDIEECQYDDCMFEFEGEEWMVLTEEEADERWDEALENYIDECILYELPEQYQRYFDREAWKRDARMDGRAHSLGHYDGNELDLDGGYVAYRTN